MLMLMIIIIIMITSALCLPRRLLAKTFGVVRPLPDEGGTSDHDHISSPLGINARAERCAHEPRV